MRRREFLRVLGGAASALPLRARAQQQAHNYRLGIMTPAPREAPQVLALFDELRKLGFVQGENLTVLGGFSLRNDELGQVADDLAAGAPQATICTGLAMRVAVERMRKSPIVAISRDLVAEGLVGSMARPHGNVTGISLLSPELDGKRQEILLDALPGARHIAMLVDQTGSAPPRLQELPAAANARGVKLEAFNVSGSEQIEGAMAAAKASGAAGLNVLAAALFSAQRRIVIAKAAALQFPAIYEWAEMAEDGGLLAYGPRLQQIYRQVARQAAKLLRGAKPADVPTEQPTNFEFVINLKAARAMGLDLPAGLVLRADKIIE